MLHKQGKLYLRIVLAAALLAAALFAYAALAQNPSASPDITISSNASLANASYTAARDTDTLIGYANFSSNTTEENSTFTWYKRTQYQPQSKSLVAFVLCEMVSL